MIDTKNASDPAVPTRVSVTLDQLRDSDNNPRRVKRPTYEEMKESIHLHGLCRELHITRRNPSELYVLKYGGSTRLEIVRELYQETNEEKFYRIDCMFHPWVDEEDAVTSNLANGVLQGRARRLVYLRRLQAMWRECVHKLKEWLHE